MAARIHARATLVDRCSHMTEDCAESSLGVRDALKPGNNVSPRVQAYYRQWFNQFCSDGRLTSNSNSLCPIAHSNSGLLQLQLAKFSLLYIQRWRHLEEQTVLSDAS
jgi:hypothetical protein